MLTTHTATSINCILQVDCCEMRTAIRRASVGCALAKNGLLPEPLGYRTQVGALGRTVQRRAAREDGGEEFSAQDGAADGESYE